MATKVQLNFIRASILTIFVLSSQIRTEINPTSKILKKNQKDSFHRGEALESVVLRYLRQVENNSSLVHLIIETEKEDSDKSRETIVKTCSNFRIPVKLLLFDESTKNRTAQSQPRYPKFRYVLAISRNISKLQPEKWKEAYIDAWKSGAFFAIFIEGQIIDEKRAELLLKKFWAIDCSNVVLIGLNSSSSNLTKIPKIYSYDPFSTVTEGVDGTLYQVSSTESLFPDKLKNLQGQRIAMSLYCHKPSANLPKNGNFSSATGMDVELIRYASRRLNFTVDILTKDVDAASYVLRLPTGRRTGPIGDILMKKTEFLGNSQFLEIVHLYNASLDFVYPYLRSYSVVVIQRASPLPAFFYLIRKTDTSYVFYVGTLSLLIFFLYLKFVKKSTNFLLTIIGLVIFQHLPKIGTRNSDRIFCIALVYCSFVVCTVYQGYLVHDLTAPPIFPNIDTLRELGDKKNLVLMVRPYELRILNRGKTDDVKRKLAKIARVELNFSHCVAEMKKSKNVACTIDESYGKFSLSQIRKYQLRTATKDRKIGKEGPPMHIVKESLIDFWQSYVVRKGFPYLEKINEAMARAFEFGLIRKWLRDDKRKRFNPPPESKEPEALSLLHLDYTFAVLIIGYILAILAFVFEIIVAGGFLKNFEKKFFRGFRRIFGRE